MERRVRRFIFLLASVASLSSVASVAPSFAGTPRRLWTGEGQTNKASEAMNWQNGIIPHNGDRVLFGHTSNKDCDWDFDVSITSLTVSHEYHGRISLGTHQLDVTRHVRVAGGVLDLAEGVLAVHGLLYMDKGGTVQLSQGELRLGRKGLLVDDGGVLLSTGDKPAHVKAADGEYYDFRVGNGTVNIANPSGTVIERSKGVILYSKAKVEKAAKISVKQVPAGATGVTVYAKQADQVDLEDWDFDETVGHQVDAPAAAKKGQTVAIRRTPAPAQPETPPVLPIVKSTEAAPAEEAEEAPKGPSMSEALAEDAKMKVTPLFDLEFLGGQYFFKGQQGNLSGNGSLLAAPAIKFNERWTLLPMLSSSYQGTKQVVDLVGAGTLFQQRLDNRLAAKAVYTPEPDSPWRLKPSASAKWEMLEETRDESWGHGLFDYQKYGAGFEGEYVYKEPLSVRASYDYAFTHFPNYTTLESRQKFDINGQPLARELVGGHTLDNNGHALTLAGTAQPLAGFFVEPMYVLLLQDYPNQRRVTASGDFSSSLRSDVTNLLDVTVRNPRALREDLKIMPSLGLGAVFARSNQASYDALNAKFLPGYYDYDEYSIRPAFTTLMGGATASDKPLAMTLGVNYTVRRYLSRPTQDPLGAYRSTRITERTTLLNAMITVPMDKNFSLVGNVQYGHSDSNMAFQQFYTYDYDSLNYLFGVSWEY